MNRKTLEAAKREAKEFLDSVSELEDSGKPYVIGGSRESGAVKRKSMDLTRALSDLRKP